MMSVFLAPLSRLMILSFSREHKFDATLFVCRADSTNRSEPVVLLGANEAPGERDTRVSRVLAKDNHLK